VVVSALLALGAVAVVVVGLVATSGEATGRPGTLLPPHPVAGGFRPSDTTLAECSEQTCFEQAFGNIAYRRGPKAAIALFERRIADNEAGCHRIAHTIGAAALARYEGNVARTFAEGTSSCWSGYYHGVLERSLLSVESFTRGALASISRNLCSDAQVRAVPWLAFQCLHGLGHGLMISTGYDLRLSLDVCRRLETASDGEACKGGAFMENLSPMYGGTSRWLRDDDPLYPCTAVARSDRYECYKRSTTRMLAVLGFDWERIARTCASLEGDLTTACFTSYGRDASAQNERQADEIRPLCVLARPYGAERTCIAAAAMDVTSNYARGQPATVLCDSTETRRLRGACYEAVGSITGRFRRKDAERVADCRALSPDHRDVARCVRGARRGARTTVIR
jgi:hypothetical protein